MKTHGVESVKITSNIGDETKTVTLDGDFKDKVAKVLDSAGIKYERDVAIGAKSEGKGTTSTMKLKKVLRVLGVNQRTVAKELAISEVYLSYVLHGRKPSRRLRRALMLWFERLIFDEGPK